MTEETNSRLPKIHLPGLEPCPHLPVVEEVLAAAAMQRCGSGRGPDFYHQALLCAQSLWLQGLPAQSLLLINRAFGADLKDGDAILGQWPLPYAAAAWVMRRRRPEQFIGNPRRHYQHLATRMVPPRRELRSWRAWGCWYFACRIFPDASADEVQIRDEGVREPSGEQIEENISRLGLENEAQLWLSVATGL